MQGQDWPPVLQKQSASRFGLLRRKYLRGASILLVGIFPRREQEQRVAKLNEQIVRLAGDENIIFANPGSLLLIASGKIEESYFEDGLHPNVKGYELFAKALKPYLVTKVAK